MDSQKDSGVKTHGEEIQIMGFEFIKKLPTPEEIRSQYPIDDEVRKVKAERDEEIRRIIKGESSRFLRSSQ